jgi:hypothetical protein
MLFNILANIPTIIISRACWWSNIYSSVPDDTIYGTWLCKSKKSETTFEKILGLKINFHKSESFYFAEAQDDAYLYAEFFGCGLGQFTISYLGIPVHFRRLANAEWKHVEGRLE